MASDGSAAKDDSFVFDIDPCLFVDTNKLIRGEIIGERHHFVVYKGCYELHPVSIKTMFPKNTSEASSDCKSKFQQEVNLLSRIKHENIVKFIGATVEPSMMIIKELLEGGTLHKHLRSIYPTTLDLKQSISFALHISQAMEYLHVNNIIHRDLQPGNLLLSKDKMQIKLSEFGMAREEICDKMTCELDASYPYMAPELFNKEPLLKGEKKWYDHKVDVYSFAIILWRLTTNQIPFKGRDGITAAYDAIRNIRPSVDNFPEELLPLLKSCWEEDPKLRPEFADITQTLTKLLNNSHTKEEVDHHEAIIETPSIPCLQQRKLKNKSSMLCLCKCFACV